RDHCGKWDTVQRVTALRIARSFRARSRYEIHDPRQTRHADRDSPARAREPCVGIQRAKTSIEATVDTARINQGLRHQPRMSNMQAHVFRGPGRVSAVTTDPSGANLP